MSQRPEFEQFVIEQLMAMRGELASLHTKIEGPHNCTNQEVIEDLKKFKTQTLLLWSLLIGFVGLGGVEGIRFLLKHVSS